MVYKKNGFGDELITTTIISSDLTVFANWDLIDTGNENLLLGTWSYFPDEWNYINIIFNNDGECLWEQPYAIDTGFGVANTVTDYMIENNKLTFSFVSTDWNPAGLYNPYKFDSTYEFELSDTVLIIKDLLVSYGLGGGVFTEDVTFNKVE